MLHPIYYIIMVIMTFFSYMEVSNRNSIKSYIKFPYILLVISLILIAGTRVAQGADYWPYFELYKGSNKYVRWDGIFKAGLEPTYVIFSKILGYFQMPFFVLLFVFAIFSITLKSITYYKFSPYPIFSLLIYFMPYYFFEDSGHIRQGAGIAFCIFSFRYITQKKLLPFLLCVLLGYFFHKTSIVFLPAYWIANTYISTKQCVVAVIVSIILWPFHPYSWFGDLFQAISADVVADAFNAYGGLGELGFSINDIVKLIFIFIILGFDKGIINSNEDPNYMRVRNLVIFYYCLFYAFRGNVIFSVRLPGAYSAFYMLLLPMIVKYAKSSRMIIYMYIIIYLYLMSWRFWGNATALGFDKFTNIFNSDYNLIFFTPHEFID